MGLGKELLRCHKLPPDAGSTTLLWPASTERIVKSRIPGCLSADVGLTRLVPQIRHQFRHEAMAADAEHGIY